MTLTSFCTKLASEGEVRMVLSRADSGTSKIISCKECSVSQNGETFLSAQACLSSKLREANITIIKTLFETVGTTPKGE